MSLNSAYADSSNRVLQTQGMQSAETFSKYIDFYQDPTGTLTIDDILDAPNHPFEALKTQTPQFGFTKNTIWLRIHIQNKVQDVDWSRPYRSRQKKMSPYISCINLAAPLTFLCLWKRMKVSPEAQLKKHQRISSPTV